jgi:hypothetical protein
MDDQPNRSTDPADAGSSSGSTGAGGTGGTGAGDSFGWNTEGAEAPGQSGTADRIMSQLQQMIDTVATQAAPVARQIGAKAAELAAIAAERAGPIAHKAADATADASVKIAERSRGFAADLRRESGAADDDTPDTGASAAAGTSGTWGSTGAPAEGTSSNQTGVIDGIDSPSEQLAKDDPAEGAIDASGTGNPNQI